MKKILTTAIILVFIVIVCLLLSLLRDNKDVNEYYKNDVMLKGVVMNKSFLGKEEGIFYIDISECNKDEFDLRSVNKPYNLIVKKKKAEFLFTGYNYINFGDSVVINFKKRSACIKRLNDTIINYKFGDVLYSKWYKKKLRQLHKL